MSSATTGGRSALEPCFRTAALLLRKLQPVPADKLAGSLWRTHREKLIACIEGDQRRLRPAALSLLASLAASNAVVARELLQELERSGTRIDRGLREAEAGGGSPQLVALGLALIGTDDPTVLLRLLSGEHRRLASAPLRLLPRVPEGLQLRVLAAVHERILRAAHLPVRAKLAPCTGTLEAIASLLGSGGAVADAAHAHLVFVCTTLMPAWLGRGAGGSEATSSEGGRARAASGGGGAGSGGGGGGGGSGGSRATAQDAVLKLVLELRPTAQGRQQRLLLATLKALPQLLPSYLRLRAAPSAASEPRCSRGWFAQLAFLSRLAAVALDALAEQQPPPASPADAAAASALLDSTLPGALGRPFWSKALLHPSFLVRLYATNALLALLPRIAAALVRPLAARASAASTAAATAATATAAAAAAAAAAAGSASLGLRLLRAELQRRLPDAKVLLSGIASASGGVPVPVEASGAAEEGDDDAAGTAAGMAVGAADGRSGSGGGGGSGGNKLARLIEARLLEALELYISLLPATAAEGIGMAEKLLRARGTTLPPVTLCNALRLAQRAAGEQPSLGASDWAQSRHNQGAIKAHSWREPLMMLSDGPAPTGTAVDIIQLLPAAELTALIEHACRPQPLELRPPLWRHLGYQLRQCGALHLCASPAAETVAWLRSLRSAADPATLASLLHMCVGSLHAFVDRASELSAQAQWCLPNMGAATLPNMGAAPVRLSPLAACALAQLTAIVDDKEAIATNEDEDEVERHAERRSVLGYLCRSLGAIGAAHPPSAALLHRACASSPWASSLSAESAPMVPEVGEPLAIVEDEEESSDARRGASLIWESSDAPLLARLLASLAASAEAASLAASAEAAAKDGADGSAAKAAKAAVVAEGPPPQPLPVRGKKRKAVEAPEVADPTEVAAGAATAHDDALRALLEWHGLLCASRTDELLVAACLVEGARHSALLYDGGTLAPALMASASLRDECSALLLGAPGTTLGLGEPLDAPGTTLPRAEQSIRSMARVTLVGAWLRATLALRWGGAATTEVPPSAAAVVGAIRAMRAAWLSQLVAYCCRPALEAAGAVGQAAVNSGRAAVSTTAVNTWQADGGRASLASRRQVLHVASVASSLVRALISIDGDRSLLSAAECAILADRLFEAAAAAPGERARPAAAALCTLLLHCPDCRAERRAGRAHPARLALDDVRAATELSLRAVRLDAATEHDVEAVCASVLALLRTHAASGAFDEPPETLLYEVRDFVRAAASVPMLHTARAIFEETSAGRTMRPLLPQLQRLLLDSQPSYIDASGRVLGGVTVLERVRRAPVRDEGAGTALLETAREQLRLLQVLAFHAPIALSPEHATELLKASTCLPRTARPLVWAVFAIHVSRGMPLPSLESANAADFASHAAHISQARALAASHGGAQDGAGRTSRDRAAVAGAPPTRVDAPSWAPVELMRHEVAALQWALPDEWNAMADAFPLSALVPPTTAPTAREQEAVPLWRAGEGEGGGAALASLHAQRYRRSGGGGGRDHGRSRELGCDPLGALLTLRHLLNTAPMDARQWVERGGVGLCVAALAAAAPAVRVLAYECLGCLMGLLETGPSFVERRQVYRLLASLRDAVTEANAQLPCVTVQFVAHGLRVLLRPTHPQYRALNAYVVGRPYLKLDEVPMFFEAFHGGGAPRVLPDGP